MAPAGSCDIIRPGLCCCDVWPLALPRQPNWIGRTSFCFALSRTTSFSCRRSPPTPTWPTPNSVHSELKYAGCFVLYTIQLVSTRQPGCIYIYVYTFIDMCVELLNLFFIVPQCRHGWERDAPAMTANIKCRNYTPSGSFGKRGRMNERAWTENVETTRHPHDGLHAHYLFCCAALLLSLAQTQIQS